VRSQFAKHGSGWSDWCRQHQGQLAVTFLHPVDAGEYVSAFFGSWFEIEGRGETGYFLGHELIRELDKESSLQIITLLEQVEPHARPILAKWTTGEKL
jgi:hypothetical protein